MSVTLNYTTSISVSKTASEMQQMLGRHGASSVVTQFGADQEEVGIGFTLVGPHGERAFSLPVNVEGVHKLLIRAVAAGKTKSLSKARARSREQAARVAWRVAKDWLEAQLAMVQAQMVGLDEVMLPYLRVDGDVTLYQRYRERESNLLSAGS